MIQLLYGTLILVSELRSGLACVPKFHLNKKHTGVPQREWGRTTTRPCSTLPKKTSLKAQGATGKAVVGGSESPGTEEEVHQHITEARLLHRKVG